MLPAQGGQWHCPGSLSCDTVLGTVLGHCHVSLSPCHGAPPVLGHCPMALSCVIVPLPWGCSCPVALSWVIVLGHCPVALSCDTVLCHCPPAVGLPLRKRRRQWGVRAAVRMCHSVTHCAFCDIDDPRV